MDKSFINLVINRLGFLPKKFYINLYDIKIQLELKDQNKQKSGIYFILNIVNQHLYIGSAITNRINVRFRNHLINQTGSKLVCKAVREYELHNFIFGIIEYFPGFVKKENLDKNHILLLERETYYINKLTPEYNILLISNSTLGYKHTEKTKQLMRDNYSEERKL